MPIIGRGDGKGTRRTAVARQWYWRPETKEWTIVPVDLTHNAVVEMIDTETGQPTGRLGVYESKGWQSLLTIPEGDPRREKLPSNWRMMTRDHKEVAVMADKVKASA